MRILLLSFVLMFAVTTATADEIPIKINVGFGLSEYRLHDIYDSGDAYINGTELSIQAVVERSTITKYKNKVPEKFRKAAGKLDEVSISHWAVPQNLFIHPDDGDKSAFGATWGLVPTLSTGFKYLRFGISGGIVASYLYYDDKILDKTVHFIRPGLRGGAHIRIPLFNKQLTLEFGGKGDIYIPKTFFASDSSWKITTTYAMLHFRFPMKIKAAI